MKRSFLIFCIVFFYWVAYAQQTTPGAGVRYLNPIFTSWTTKLAEYQPGYAYKVYMPANDDVAKRPVIIVYSGGGTLDIDAVKSTCEELVKLGYVAVAGQYKKTIGEFTVEEQKKAVINTYYLIKTLRDSAQVYGIKKKKFFGIGTSAGGITWVQAGITANDTGNPYYDGAPLPNLKYCLIATASMSGSANPIYQGLISTGCVQNNFFNGGKDLLIPSKEAQKTCDLEIAAGATSFIKIYPDSDHTLGQHDDIFYNVSYGIVPTFYNKMKEK